MALTVDQLKEYLEYDGADLRWKKRTGASCRIGEIAGTVNKANGYRYITVLRKRYCAHRLIWFYHFGAWPTEIDHINRDRLDNRVENLRDIPHRVNMQNQKKRKGSVCVPGVKRHRGGFMATIRCGGKKKYLGWSKDRNEAVQMRLKAEKDLNWANAKVAT